MDENFEEKRLAMVSSQIEHRGLTEPRLLAAFRSVPLAKNATTSRATRSKNSCWVPHAVVGG